MLKVPGNKHSVVRESYFQQVTMNPGRAQILLIKGFRVQFAFLLTNSVRLVYISYLGLTLFICEGTEVGQTSVVGVTGGATEVVNKNWPHFFSSFHPIVGCSSSILESGPALWFPLTAEFSRSILVYVPSLGLKEPCSFYSCTHSLTTVSSSGKPACAILMDQGQQTFSGSSQAVGPIQPLIQPINLTVF